MVGESERTAWMETGMMAQDEGLAGASQSPRVAHGNLGMTKMATTGSHGKKTTYQNGQLGYNGV